MAPRQRSRKPVQKLTTSPLFIIVHQGTCAFKPLLTWFVKGFRSAPDAITPALVEGLG